MFDIHLFFEKRKRRDRIFLSRFDENLRKNKRRDGRVRSGVEGIDTGGCFNPNNQDNIRLETGQGSSDKEAKWIYTSSDGTRAHDPRSSHNFCRW